MRMAESRLLEPGIENDYATLLVGVDTLLGGDVGAEEGGAHFIADTFPKSERELPGIYSDPNAVALRAAGGAKPEIVDHVRAFISAHDLLDTKGRLTGSLDADASPLRRRFMENMERCFGVMAQTAVALAEGTELPPYEERYEAAARRAPQLVETKELREQLRDALARVGIEVMREADLRNAVNIWEKRIGYVPAEGFSEAVHRSNVELMSRVRSELFAKIGFNFPGFERDLSNLGFDGFRFNALSNVHYTGSSTFEGGTHPDGRPAQACLIEYNTDHPVTTLGLPHLISHEISPGHYVDSCVSDLGWRAGNLGIEAVMHTMCTAEVTLREGWAQNALAALHGGTESDLVRQFGPDQVVQQVLERFQDAGKQNASIKFQMMGEPIEEVRRHLREDCVLSDPIVKKLSGSWAQDPVHGPMYGGAYDVGYHTVRQAIETHGIEAVAKACFHHHGYLDIETFGMALGQ